MQAQPGCKCRVMQTEFPVTYVRAKHQTVEPSPAPTSCLDIQLKAAAVARAFASSFSSHRRIRTRIIFYSASSSPNTGIMFNFVLSLLLQLSMFMMAEAAPITAQGAEPWQAGTGGGIVGFIVLVLDIIAWSTFPSHTTFRAVFGA